MGSTTQAKSADNVGRQATTQGGGKVLPVRRITMNRSAAVALLWAAGCTGNIAGDAEGNGAGEGTGPSGDRGNGPVNAPCGNAEVPRVRTWRLTNTQFQNTARAVFGFVGPTAEQLPSEAQPDGFANQADRLSIPPLLASKYLQAAEEIADSVLARSGEFLDCPVAALGTGTCLRDFLDRVGARAWRRPLTGAEVEKYTRLFAAVAPSSGPEVAWKGVVQALVLSPHFLFRTELGGGGAAGSVTRLTDHELASALSYMLWDGPPDATLMQLAASGRLHEPASLAAQVRRLLGSAQASSQVVGSFFRQWLQFDTLAAMTNKDATLFPSYTPELVSDLVAESQALIDGVFFEAGGDRSVKTLLTATYGYVNSRTAPLYGVQASGTALVKTALPAAQRRGLLTGAAFIAALSDSDDTNLPARGRTVREQVLCEAVAPPAGNFQLDDPKITADMTAREKFITHTTNPACAACHDLFDGIGYAMEQYDPIGRFRTMDKMKTIDPSGTLSLASGTLRFASYVELVDQLAALPETYACVAAQYAAHATGRAAAGIGSCERDAISKAFADGGYRLEALVSAVVTSPNFTLRRN
jgi:uncharacterized protein DUF1592/uncharacterized protein DUF1588/uncharacterized protein DUF1595/uncharacterized protein DUF1587/uncharacterized protein DUF1585